MKIVIYVFLAAAFSIAWHAACPPFVDKIHPFFVLVVAFTLLAAVVSFPLKNFWLKRSGQVVVPSPVKKFYLLGQGILACLLILLIECFSNAMTRHRTGIWEEPMYRLGCEILAFLFSPLVIAPFDYELLPENTGVLKRIGYAVGMAYIYAVTLALLALAGAVLVLLAVGKIFI